MSFDAMRWVWNLQIVKGTDKFVLLSMADRADERHCCYPSMSRLQFDTGLNIKTIEAALRRLRDAGIIQKTGRKMGQTKSTPEYRLIGVRGREEAFKETKHVCKTATCPEQKKKHPQNRSTPKNGAPPILPTSSPEIGGGSSPNFTEKHPQNRGTEPIIEPISKPITESSTSFPEGESFLLASNQQISQQQIICTLPLNDGSDFEVTQDFVAEVAPLYPNVDVVQALRAMKGWLIGNQKRRKTRRGIKAFITGWLSREQDKPKAVGAAYEQGQAPQPRSYRDCVDLEQRQENDFLNQLQEQLDGKRDSGANSLGAGQAQSAIIPN